MTRQFPNRRDVLKAGALATLGTGSFGSVGVRTAAAGIAAGPLPNEPLEIGREPQFVHDLYTVDCTWALLEKQAPVRRVFHAGEKPLANPFFTDDNPSHFWVERNEQGLFQMWYQLNQRVKYDQPRQQGQPIFRTFMGYAQSTDGLAWERPDLKLFPDAAAENLPRNCLLHRPDSPRSGFDTPQIVAAPEADRRGFRYVMFYLGTGPGGFNGLRLIGSQDGIHWDLASDTQLAKIASDHHNTIVYDPLAKQYVMYLRAKQIYLAPGQGRERIDTGQSRRGVARMTSQSLWEGWTGSPQTILVPDETDAESKYNYFYGMPVQRTAGISWGFLQSFRMNDYMHAELTWSRDGIHFDRLPQRPKLIEYGPEGTWDDTMILACPRWIEVGDEWWVYYNGWDGPHQTGDRTGGIGLAKFRKEGFVSLRGPAGGGVVCTRTLRWPGGDLAVNADASAGELRVRVSDPLRKPLAGYNYDESSALTAASSTKHVVRWQDRSLDTLKGQTIRLEVFLKDADLYTFRAAESA